jgi:hypothetical protein
LLSRNEIKNWLPRKDLSPTQKVLLVLACDGASTKQIKDVKQVAATHGAPGARKWNISQLLARSGGRAVRTERGWELNRDGRSAVQALIGTPPAPAEARSLRDLLDRISNGDSRAFAAEAVECFEARHYRAAVVLSWVGTISLLFDVVVRDHLAAFNAAAVTRHKDWRMAKNADGLARMKEANFLEVAEELSIIGKSVKQELLVCLTLRNGCGHPNTLRIAGNRVAAHIESLILNVFARFV